MQQFHVQNVLAVLGQQARDVAGNALGQVGEGIGFALQLGMNALKVGADHHV